MKADPERAATPLLSFVLMTLAVLGSVAVLSFTLLARRRYARFFEERGLLDGLGLPARFFLEAPAPVYAGLFVLLVAGLLVKEVALERKTVALRLNVLAVAALLLALLGWYASVRWPALRIEQAGAP